MADRGFTLLELMLCIAVFVTTAGFAAPAMKSLVTSVQLMNFTRHLAHSLHWARVHALTHSVPVGVCPRRAPDADQCGGGYHQGWLIFQDLDDNRRLDASDVVIRSDLGADSFIRVFNRAGDSIVTRSIFFAANGTSGSAMTLAPCPIDADTEYSSGIVLNNIVRVSVRSNLSACHDQNS